VTISGCIRSDNSAPFAMDPPFTEHTLIPNVITMWQNFERMLQGSEVYKNSSKDKDERKQFPSILMQEKYNTELLAQHDNSVWPQYSVKDGVLTLAKRRGDPQLPCIPNGQLFRFLVDDHFEIIHSKKHGSGTAHKGMNKWHKDIMRRKRECLICC